MKIIRQITSTTLFAVLLLGLLPSVPTLSAQSSPSTERRLFPIRQGDIKLLELRAFYREKTYSYIINVTLTRRRTLEWRLATLGDFTRDKAGSDSFTRNFTIGVELAEGWTDDSLSAIRSVEESFLHTFTITCDSLEQALARMKLLEPKCVEQASAEDTPK